MRHRPNFCCECGEKIDRIEWHVWTSRRFCELCETQNQLDEWLPRIIGAFCLVVGLFGIGSSIVTAERRIDLMRSPVKLAEQRAEALNVVADRPDPTVVDLSGHADRAESVSAPRHSEQMSRDVRKPDTIKAVPLYICGAETKKGTACTRRVKGGGRCWQHSGKEAMIPEEELLVVETPVGGAGKEDR
ncbi:MAG: hypothetical protein DWQ47_16605 [Acidobacteria bacterium]|nr:MAG: hypothetical protein DWQ32_04005 [Acidobacteriota bacterium]REK02332.1 MAG: hypothetical protein DWQ38_08135 [Acidobacteriota bacterium]REK13866.1 MAG: hypothetical protein DWQ43_09695 [Acidobacteriota bacterium]REK41861.1 MAG: hypothetical protein DWQ47_16605 [Acidobacteriota bacterium]